MTRMHILQLMAKLGIKMASERPNSGGYLPALCPLAPWLHERGVDSHPSFFVKVEDHRTSGWHCFTCKAKGSRLSSLVRKLEFYREETYANLAMKVDLLEIPDEFGTYDDEVETVAKPVPLDAAVYDGLYPDAWEELASRKYLQKRKVGKAACAAMQLKFDPEERRVLFPIIDKRGDLFGFSGRSILEPEDTPKGYSRHRDYGFHKEQFLLGEHLIRDDKPMWVVEGLFAYAHMVEIGARDHVNPVAPMMSSISPFQKERLIDYGQSVYLCFDPDKAGDQGMFGTKMKDGSFAGGGAVDKLKKELTVLVPPYPDTVTDIDNVTLDELLWMKENAEIP